MTDERVEKHVHDVEEPTELPNGDFTYDCMRCRERDAALDSLVRELEAARREPKVYVHRDRYEALERRYSAAREVVEAMRELADPPLADPADYEDEDAAYVRGFERAKAIVAKRAQAILSHYDEVM